MTQTSSQPTGTRKHGVAPILEVKDLVKHYPLTGGRVIRRRVGEVHATCGVSFDLYPGETIGLVGESGCGKSTTGKTILQLQPPTSGSVRFQGEELVGKTRKQMRPIRRNLQVVFQDPYASLNPRVPVNDIVAEPIQIHHLDGKQGKERLDLAYLFIAHDLSVVRHISDRVAVMYLGKIVEIGSREAIYERASHPY